MTSKKTLKKWFSNFMKPAQEHFYAWIDSFWHKDEKIPMASIEGLERIVEGTASAGQLLNHLNDTNAHRKLFDQKVDKEAGKGLSSNDFSNEHKQKLEELQPTDTSALLSKGGYEGTGQTLKELIDALEGKITQVKQTLTVDDTAFDTLQEIVTQVKANKNLETLLTRKLDKEVYFEKLKEILQLDFNNEVNGVVLDNKMGTIHISSKSLILHGEESVSVIGNYASISSNATTAIESKGGVYVRSFNGGGQILPFFQVDAQNVNIRGDQTNKYSISQYKVIELIASETIEFNVPTFRINGVDFLERIEALERRLVELEQRVNYPAP